jgi:hypothetical protein
MEEQKWVREIMQKDQWWRIKNLDDKENKVEQKLEQEIQRYW